MQNSINYEMLAECSNELRTIAINMQDITSQVSTIVKNIEKNGSWVGDGADYFQQQFRKIEPNFLEAYTQVLNYATTLEDVVNKYKKMDSNISKIIG